MHKNGFTLVEIAIVLVVIGMIIGMSIQIFKLRDVAELKADVIRMHKFEVAVRTYYADNMIAPYAYPDTGGKIESTVLTDNGYLSIEDFYSTWDKKYWEFYRCSAGGDNETHHLGYRNGAPVERDGNGVNVCAIMTDTRQVSNVLSCAIEVQIDDENYEQGLGRANPATVKPASVDFLDCDNSTGSTTYIYRVL